MHNHYTLQDFKNYLVENKIFNFEKTEKGLKVLLTEKDIVEFTNVNFVKPPTTLSIDNSFIKRDYIKLYSIFSKFVPNFKIYLSKNGNFVGVLLDGKLTTF